MRCITVVSGTNTWTGETAICCPIVGMLAPVQSSSDWSSLLSLEHSPSLTKWTSTAETSAIPCSCGHLVVMLRTRTRHGSPPANGCTQSPPFKKKLAAHKVHVVTSMHAPQFDSHARQLPFFKKKLASHEVHVVLFVHASQCESHAKQLYARLILLG